MVEGIEMNFFVDIARRSAESMRVFADGDESFCLGEWKSWKDACYSEGRTIPPAEFKALPKEERMSYRHVFKHESGLK